MIKEINWQREVAAGIYGSFLVICFTQAAVVLIFTGKLNALLPFGLAGGFLGVTVVNFFYGLTSRFPYSLATTSASLGAIIIMMIRDLSRATNPEQFLPTALAALLISTIAVGLLMLISGMTRIVRLLRYMPYPVIGGFMAVTAWMMLLGSLQVMQQDLPAPVSNLVQLLSLHWVGIAYGILMFLAVKYINSRYTYVYFTLGTILLIHSYLYIVGVDHNTAVQKGFFLSNMKMSLMLDSWNFQELMNIKWKAILDQSNYFIVIAITAILIQTFRLNALEATSISKKLLDKEISSCGIGVFISGIVGGVLTTPAVPVSVLLHRFGVKTVIPVIISMILILAMMIFTPNLLSYMPKSILVGLIIFSALELFNEWLWQTFWRLPYEDYAIILLILMSAILFGFMVSIGFGIILASTFFLVKYSRINNVKYTLTGKEIRSKHKYSYSVEEYLRQVGRRTLIMKLQGYLFFGSSRRLLENIYYLFKHGGEGRYRHLIMDFQLVTGLDISSIMNFIILGEITYKHNVKFILSNCNEGVKQQFNNMATRKWLENKVIFMPTLDYAQEWCEQEYLLDKKHEEREDINLLFSDCDKQKTFLSYLNRQELEAGSYLFQQGEPSDSMYFVQSGQVTAFIISPEGHSIRIFTTESNVLLGEMGFFSGNPRSATVIADTHCVVCQLTVAILNQIEDEHPELIIEFYESVIQLLSNRINELNLDLELFQR